MPSLVDLIKAIAMICDMGGAGTHSRASCQAYYAQCIVDREDLERAILFSWTLSSDVGFGQHAHLDTPEMALLRCMAKADKK